MSDTVAELVEQAVTEFGFSLKDDPTAWGEVPCVAPSTYTNTEIKKRCNKEARTVVAAKLRRRVYKFNVLLAEDISVALSENGALADFATIQDKYLKGMRIDCSRFASAGSYAELEREVNDALFKFIDEQASNCRELTFDEVLAYVQNDDRLTPSQRAEIEPNSISQLEDALVRQRRCARMERHESQNPSEALSLFNIVTAVAAAGVSNVEIARCLGFTPGYIGHILKGRKPCPALRPDQTQALKMELEARYAALGEVLAVLN